ncbi:hypothetical protein DMH03_32940 [Amycolatopsis sp. WAC 01376]|uniref:hypothetical protein n=1 Tax=Amycolatopsis sp. WAC 01376 TaxID=2203195 RepID=UPI000F78289C|nr:hypothetical protein [Amycolatopsis sp. WAC 01376]RSM56296.1 hypothetical protein DMH03_32940 [Amycolatopsis sp. WAC 01376]
MAKGALSFEEIAVTRRWLAKRGVEVVTPSRLLAARVGPRLSRTVPGRFRWLAVAVAVGVLLGIVYGFVDFRDGEAPSSVYLCFVGGALQVAFWWSYVHRERELGPLPVMDRRSGRRPPVLGILGGWYASSFVITFGGGVALALAVYLSTPAKAKAYATGWLLALGWAALCCSVILLSTLRRPVHAEDRASMAVDTELRVMDSQYAIPGVYAVVVLYDPLLGDGPPAEFTGWLIAYAVLGIGTTLLGFRQHRSRPALPPGDYATPVGCERLA